MEAVVKNPKEIRESKGLRATLPKIDIDEILDVHKKISRMKTEKFWQLFNTRTNIRKKAVGKNPNKINEGSYPTVYADDDADIDLGKPHITSVGYIPDKGLGKSLGIPMNNNMTWECVSCRWRFISSWSSVDEEAHGFPNPLCPKCGRWEHVGFIK